MTDISRSLDELWVSLLLQFPGLRTESRNGPCFEMLGWSGKLKDPRVCVISNPERKFSAGYATAELFWYLCGSDSQEMIQAYAPQYARFCNDGVAKGAYGARWRDNPGIAAKGVGLTSLQAAYALLRDKRDDRRAVVTMFDSGDVVEAIRGEWRDIPCTLSMQFLVREGQLHMIVSMRSNDAWLGTPYDIHCFCQIQMLMAAALGCSLGTYTHFVGSMHLYETNSEKAMKAVGANCSRVPVRTPMPSRRDAEEFFARGLPPQEMIMAEMLLRVGTQHEKDRCIRDLTNLCSADGSWWAGKLLLCARKLGLSVEEGYLPGWATFVSK
jgi:thymidylate synthase